MRMKEQDEPKKKDGTHLPDGEDEHHADHEEGEEQEEDSQGEEDCLRSRRSTCGIFNEGLPLRFRGQAYLLSNIFLV